MGYYQFDYRLGPCLTPYEVAQAQANQAAQRAYRRKPEKSKSGVPIVPLKKERK